MRASVLGAVLMVVLTGCGAGAGEEKIPTEVSGVVGEWNVTAVVLKAELSGHPCQDLDGDGVEETCAPESVIESRVARVSINSSRGVLALRGLCTFEVPLREQESGLPAWRGGPGPCYEIAAPQCPAGRLQLHEVTFQRVNTSGTEFDAVAYGQVIGCDGLSYVVVRLTGLRGADGRRQAPPSGTYGGTLTILSWSGPDTRRCAQDTPLGSTTPLYITITGSVVQERINPACELTSADPSDYRFVCVNHNLPETCDAGSVYWDPVAGNCDAYFERREFRLSFSRDATMVTGTVTDTRNWGGCSVRVWSVSFERRPIK